MKHSFATTMLSALCLTALPLAAANAEVALPFNGSPTQFEPAGAGGIGGAAFEGPGNLPNDFSQNVLPTITPEGSGIPPIFPEPPILPIPNSELPFLPNDTTLPPVISGNNLAPLPATTNVASANALGDLAPAAGGKVPQEVCRGDLNGLVTICEVPLSY